MSVRPGAEPYAHDGDDVGVLLCHGFTSNPASLRPWAEAAAGAGHTVRLPRLPGHGTTWREMGRTTWADWLGELDAAFTELRARSRVVVVGGLSMGGALVLRLAEDNADRVAGVVVVNPAIATKRFDAQTGAQWGAFAARTLTHSTVVDVPGVAHAAYFNPCAARVTRSFLRHPRTPDTRCVRRVHPRPFEIRP